MNSTIKSKTSEKAVRSRKEPNVESVEVELSSTKSRMLWDRNHNLHLKETHVENVFFHGVVFLNRPVLTHTKSLRILASSIYIIVNHRKITYVTKI